MLRVVGEVGVHLTNDVDILGGRLGEGLCLGEAESAWTVAVHHLDASGVLTSEAFGHLTGAVRRAIIDDEQSEPVVFEYAGHEQREVLGLVQGREYGDGPLRGSGSTRRGGHKNTRHVKKSTAESPCTQANPLTSACRCLSASTMAI